MSATEDAFARASGEGIHRLAIPTPFAVGRVNCYLVEDEPLTLVDTGPNPSGAPPPRTQSVGHGLLGCGAPDPDRRGSSARPHLVKPAGVTPARGQRPRRRRGAPPGARHLHRVNARHA